MNNVTLIGRLTKDIELKYATISGKAIAKFTLAVNRDYKNQEGNYDADFINCLAFDKRAETLANYVKKGQQVAVKGKIQTGSYDAQDGTKRYTTEVLIEGFDFIGGQGSGGNNGSSVSNGQSNNYDAGYSEEWANPVEDDDEIPF